MTIRVPLAAGASVALSLAPGQSVKLTGTGTAQIVPPVPYGLPTSPWQTSSYEITIGPFDSAVTINIVASGAMTYSRETLTDAEFAAVVAAGMLETDGTIYRVGSPEVWYHATSASAYSAMGGSGGGTGYLDNVATTAALTGLTGAVIGSTANVGASAAAMVLYELKALPGTIEANWQALQGTVANGTLISIELVDGKLPRRLRVFVPTGNQVTVTVGGITQPVLTESAQPHVVEISDDPAVAAPTSVTVQRTAGSATTGWYSLEG